MSLCIYVGNAIKDTVCADRPKCPPVKRIGKSERGGEHAMEYGFASTHTINSFVLSAYVVWASSFRESVAAWAAVGAWTLSIAYGRIYLGMHSPIDVVAGLFIGIALLVFWIGAEPFVEAFLTQPSTGIVVPFQLLMSICTTNAYPRPLRPTPSFTYAVYFSGCCSGIVIGVWRTYQTFHSPSAQLLSWNTLWSLPSDNDALFGSILPVLGNTPALWFAARMLVRFVVGLIIVIASRSASKSLLVFVLPRLCNVAGIDAKQMPDELNGPKRPESSNTHNLTTAVRLIVYGVVGWTVVSPAFTHFAPSEYRSQKILFIVKIINMNK